MCSIFAAVSKKSRIDKKKCLLVLGTSNSRGPDFSYTYTTDNIFIGCNVLSITGTPKKHYYKQHNMFLAYNGEVYNYNTKENELPDTHFILKEFIRNNNYEKVLYNLDGMFGIVLYDEHTGKIHIARDVQGEKTLYIYEDDNFFIVSSTLASIEAFIGKLTIDEALCNYYLYTRHFLTYNKTIYDRVYQLQPGGYIAYNTNTHIQKKRIFKKLTDAYSEESVLDNNNRPYGELLEELDFLLDKNIRQMLPRRKCSVSFSGGIDSSLTAAYINKYTTDFLPVATNCLGKDYITSDLSQFKNYITPSIHTLCITSKEWYNALWETYKIIRMPLPSHNYCTKKILAEFLNKNNVKVCFGGEGADELFGGYNFYKDIKNIHANPSPYSSFVDYGFCGKKIYNERLMRYLSYIWYSFYTLTKDVVAATSFTDTFLVVADDGLRNSDQICGFYGVEGRSPFMRWDIIKFALNLPSKYKRGKVMLYDLFKKYYPGIQIQEKQGFAGFPCETYNFFNKKICDFNVLTQFGVNNTAINTPAAQWKLLNLQYFYECYNSRYIFNPS